MKRLLAQFQKLIANEETLIEYAVLFKGEKPGKRLLFTACIHGDEIGSVPAFLELIQKFKNKEVSFNGEVVFALGNIEAIKLERRFVENDLNRLFFSDSNKNYEHKRAQELKSLIDSSDFHVDFHQTIEETGRPFFVTVNSPITASFADQIGTCDTFLELSLEESLRYGTATGYAYTKNVPSVCIELSQKGIASKAQDLAIQTMQRAIDISSFEGLKIRKNYKLKVYTVNYEYPFTSPLVRLTKKLSNFTLVHKNEVIGLDENEKLIKAPFNGYIVFPKYPKRDKQGRVIGELPLDLFEFAQI